MRDLSEKILGREVCCEAYQIETSRRDLRKTKDKGLGVQNFQRNNEKADEAKLSRR